MHVIRQRKRPTGSWGAGVEPFTIRVHDDEDHFVTVMDHEVDDDGTERLVPTRVPGLALDLLETPAPGAASGGGDALEDQILSELKRRAPLSRNGLARALSRRVEAVGAALRTLEAAGRVTPGTGGYALVQAAPSDLWEGIDDGF